MKLVRQIFWILILLLLVVIFAQNKDFLLLTDSFEINLWFKKWFFPNTTVLFLLLVTFGIGVLGAYSFTVASRYRLHRKVLQLQQLLTDQKEAISRCERKVAALEASQTQLETPDPKI